MDPMNAFEQQLSRVATEVAGPARPVDATAIVRSAKAAPVHHWSVHVRGFRGGVTTRTEGGFTMFSALKFIAASVIVALFGGFLLSGVLTTPDDDQMVPAAMTPSPSPTAIEESTFPTGTFVEAESGYSPRLIFRDDGTFQRSIIGTHSADGTYAVDGDLYTELTNNSDRPGGNAPASYRWAWDGEQLRFSASSVDEDGYRSSIYTEHVYVMDKTSDLLGGTRRLLLSDPRLDMWVTVEVRERDDGRYEARATVDAEPLGEGGGATLQDAVRAALEALGEPFASDIAESVKS